MNLTLTEDEVRIILQALAGSTGHLMNPDCIRMARIVQSAVKKLQPKKSPKKKGK